MSPQFHIAPAMVAAVMMLVFLMNLPCRAEGGGAGSGAGSGGGSGGDSGGGSPATQPKGESVVLQLGTTFSDNMVLQRDQPVVIWGKARRNVAVQIQLDKQEATAKADAVGRWQVTLKPLPVGGPYTLKVSCGPESVSVRNMLSGDVWLCSGQSNMQFTVWGDTEAAQMHAAAKKLPNLRLLTIPRLGGPQPVYRVDAQWQRADQADINLFTAVGFHLGVALMSNPALKGVPIGLIDDSVGGTSAEAWTPKAGLRGIKKTDYSISMLGIKASGLYNHMIAPLGPLSLKGAVWYQGESNAGKAGLYPRIMTSLITSWREQFNSPRMPFIIVQLPGFFGSIGGLPFTWMREAEAKIVQSVPGTGLVVTTDTTSGFDLHPREKGEIGRRAALQALRLAYGQNVTADGPTLVSAKAEGPAMRIRFDTHDGPLTARGGGPGGPGAQGVRGFMLAGDEGEFHFAEAVIAGKDTVIARCPEVSAPKFVRYNWAAMPNGNLYNQAGLPAGPFRTDSGKPEPAVEMVPTLPGRRVVYGLYEATLDGDGNLASLGVAKQQFISNNLDGFACYNFPWVWGVRQLQSVTELTPASIRFTDFVMEASYSFTDDGMTIRIANLAKEIGRYHLHLAAEAEAAPRDGGIELRRGPARLFIMGIDKITQDPQGGAAIDLPINGGQTVTLQFKFSKTQ